MGSEILQKFRKQKCYLSSEESPPPQKKNVMSMTMVMVIYSGVTLKKVRLNPVSVKLVD